MSDNIWTIYISVGDEEIEVPFPEAPRLGDEIRHGGKMYVVSKVTWMLNTKSVVVNLV